jgi:uncharacterized protein YegP (UPF0339 family)
MASEVYFAIVRYQGQFRALCKSEGNNEEIWRTQDYAEKKSARHAIELMQMHAASGKVLDLAK